MTAGVLSAIMLTLLILLTALFCVFVAQGASVAVVSPSRKVENSAHTLKAKCPELKSYADADVNRNYRYHTNKCYPIGSEGPCGNNMNFQPKNEVYGFCECKSDLDSRILIYHPATEQCYYIFQKGYCNKSNEWLDINRQGKAGCHNNPCRSSNNGPEMVRFDGKCVELGKPYSTCADREVIGFVRDSRLPKCILKPFSSRSIGVPPSACAVGSVRAISGHCQPPFDFDF